MNKLIIILLNELLEMFVYCVDLFYVIPTFASLCLFFLLDLILLLNSMNIEKGLKPEITYTLFLDFSNFHGFVFL